MKHPPQEPDIVPGRKIAIVSGGVVLSIILGSLIAYGIGSCSTRGIMGPGSTDRAARLLPEVNGMETAPFAVEAQGLERHRADEAALASYAWVDRGGEIVRVPLEVAVELYLAGRRPGTGAPPAAAPAAPAPQGAPR